MGEVLRQCCAAHCGTACLHLQILALDDHSSTSPDDNSRKHCPKYRAQATTNLILEFFLANSQKKLQKKLLNVEISSESAVWDLKSRSDGWMGWDILLVLVMGHANYYSISNNFSTCLIVVVVCPFLNKQGGSCLLAAFG